MITIVKNRHKVFILNKGSLAACSSPTRPSKPKACYLSNIMADLIGVDS